MALNGAVALAVPAVALLLKRGSATVPQRASGLGTRCGSSRAAPRSRWRCRALYVVSIPFAGGLGEGAVTTFGYAYLIAAALVAVTASSLSLVSAVPLTRGALGPDRVTTHVVAAAWVAFALIAAAAGVFALAGGTLVESVLGAAYRGDAGGDVGRLVVALSPFIAVSVGFSLTFPLLFVRRRERLLPAIAVVALALQIPLAWLGARLFELEGLAAALALTTGSSWPSCSPSWERSAGSRAGSRSPVPSSRCSRSPPSACPRWCSGPSARRRSGSLPT